MAGAAYSQSKTANVLFAVEAAKRWAPDRSAVNALKPGRITATNLSRYSTAAVSPRTPWTPRRPPACGGSPSTCSPAPADRAAALRGRRG